jgi:hypothetical protein
MILLHSELKKLKGRKVKSWNGTLIFLIFMIRHDFDRSPKYYQDKLVITLVRRIKRDKRLVAQRNKKVKREKR